MAYNTRASYNLVITDETLPQYIFDEYDCNEEPNLYHIM